MNFGDQLIKNAEKMSGLEMVYKKNEFEIYRENYDFPEDEIQCQVKFMLTTDIYGLQHRLGILHVDKKKVQYIESDYSSEFMAALFKEASFTRFPFKKLFKEYFHVPKATASMINQYHETRQNAWIHENEIGFLYKNNYYEHFEAPLVGKKVRKTKKIKSAQAKSLINSELFYCSAIVFESNPKVMIHAMGLEGHNVLLPFALDKIINLANQPPQKIYYCFNEKEIKKNKIVCPELYILEAKAILELKKLDIPIEIIQQDDMKVKMSNHKGIEFL